MPDFTGDILKKAVNSHLRKRGHWGLKIEQCEMTGKNGEFHALTMAKSRVNKNYKTIIINN